jgi:predicted glycosyltransferase involved in capsule biosynthesis
VFKTSVFKLINGYSNQYRGWGGEDDDLLKRLRLATSSHNPKPAGSTKKAEVSN